MHRSRCSFCLALYIIFVQHSVLEFITLAVFVPYNRPVISIDINCSMRFSTTTTDMVHYFAFGSNLWLEQMAMRCPDSRFVGRAILPDYQWQINERGFANVVPCPGSCVHGLVYKINSIDEAQLDRNEGVRNGVYEKKYLDVTLYMAPRVLRTLTHSVMNQLSLVRGADALVQHDHRPTTRCDVLVYLSTRFNTPGRPRAEYVNRIENGIRDAVQLGVPQGFFDNAVRSFMPSRSRTPVRSSARSGVRAGNGSIRSSSVPPREIYFQRPRFMSLSMADRLAPRYYYSGADRMVVDGDASIGAQYYLPDTDYDNEYYRRPPPAPSARL